MYKSRYIQFKEVLKIDNWSVKCYTISITKEFEQELIYNTAKEHLRAWLNMENSFNSNHESVAFMIVHPGSEGVFVLLNWWVGNNMLNTNIFLAEYTDSMKFKKISGDGLFGCVWELAVIDFERRAWTTYILKQAKNSNYTNYLAAQLNDVI